MAKQLVLAVAGSGKTTKILNSISPEKRSLIVTYTNENLRSLESSLVAKYGHVPDNVCLLSYFSFLYTFCIRPYLSHALRDKSYTWNTPGYFRGAPGKSSIDHYMTKGRYLYGNRAAKLVIECEVVPKVIARLEKYFDSFLVDEVQDFAANDFNLLLALSQANVDLLFVGDFFQHTFDTSRDGSTRKNLHKKGLDAFVKEFSDAGLDVDTTTLDKTHRCSPSVCEFISSNLGIQIESHRADHTKVVVVEEKEAALDLFNDPDKVKLFFQESDKYSCFSNNWGKSKGLNGYGDVCVVLNQTTQKLFEEGKLEGMAESSKNKLYVACSRANGELYILNEEHLRDLKHC